MREGQSADLSFRILPWLEVTHFSRQESAVAARLVVRQPTKSPPQ